MHRELEVVRDGEGEAAGLVGRERVREGHLDRGAVRVARRGGGGGGRRRLLRGQLTAALWRGGLSVGLGGLGLGAAHAEGEDDGAVRLAEELERPGGGRAAVAAGAVRNEVALLRVRVRVRVRVTVSLARVTVKSS